MLRHRRNKPCRHKMNLKALTRMSRQIALHPESGTNRKTLTLQRSDPVGRAPTTTPPKNDRRRTYAGVREHVASWTHRWLHIANHKTPKQPRVPLSPKWSHSRRRDVEIKCRPKLM